MAKVTSKLQVTVPKALADRFGIRPGSEIRWVAGYDSIQVVPASSSPGRPDAEVRLQRFDEATERQRSRTRKAGRRTRAGTTRGWTREELYTRGRTR
jgi:AbrB family looped-hinge helix DNA binding protein